MPENNAIESRLLSKLDMLVTGGFYVFMCAWFIADSRSAHHTIVYIFFLLPALLHLLAALVLKNDVLCVWKNPAFLSLIAFLVYMVISSTWSGASEGLPHYATRLLYTLLFVYGVYVVTRNGLKHFERALLTACVIAIPWLIINVTLFAEAAFYDNGRFFGLNAGSHYYHTGTLLGSYLILLMTLLVNKLAERLKPLPTVLILIVAANLLYGALLTETRSILLGLGVSGAYLFLSIKGHNAIRYSLTGLAALALIGTAPYINEFTQRGDSNRFEIWGVAWERIVNKPILGHGKDAEMIMHISSGEEIHDAHNIFIEVLFEGGIVGLSLWMMFIAFIAIAGWKGRDEPLGKYVLALLIYSLIVKAFGSTGILSRPTEFWHLLWLCGGLAIAISARLTLPVPKEPEDARTQGKNDTSPNKRYRTVDIR